jgi:hypothetical protein
MHSTLRSTRVFTTETITSTLIVDQDEEETVIPIGKSELHIEAADEGGFEIYIPIDEGARDFCIASRLPRELAACLLECKPSSVSSRVVNVVASIIHAKPTSMGWILEANGIIELDLPPHDEDDVDDEPIPNQGAVARSGPSHPMIPAATPNRPVNEGCSPFGFANEALYSPSLYQQTRNEQYLVLLVQVAKVARGMPLPDQNPIFDMSVMLRDFQGDPASQKSFKFYVGDNTEWRRMVGAAGELFVSRLIIHFY